MSANIISTVNCTSTPRRPLVDVLVERLARRLLLWSERPAREPRRVDARRLAALANKRSVATAQPVRWY